MDSVLAAPLPQLRNASPGEVNRMTESPENPPVRGNARTALVLLTVALAFFIGVIARHVLFG